MTEVLDRQTIKALSADTRQTIMKMLTKRPYTASEIAKATGKHVTTVTEHLDTLEGSGLIHKKDSSNKWVYYELTSKGERLFKPQIYSWVVVFSISVVLFFTGFLRLTQPQLQSGAAREMAPMMADIAQKTAVAAPADMLAYVLLGIGVAGFGYLAYMKIMQRKALLY